MARRNSTRDRETAELRALRRLAPELEALVTSLVTTQGPRGGGSPSRARFWQHVAERQALARRRAQRENRVLLDEVQRHADWIERLWRLLREMRAHRDLLGENRLATRSADTAILAQLKRQSHHVASWQTASKMFEAEGISLVGMARGLEMADHWSQSMDVDAGRSRFVGVRSLPFDVHATTRAVWSALTAVGDNLSAPSGERESCAGWASIEMLEKSPHTYSIKYETRDIPVTVGSARPVLQCRAVVQTVVANGKDSGLHAEDVALFVWHSSTSMSHSGGAVSTGRETVCITITPCAGSSLSSTVAIASLSQADASPLHHDHQRVFLDAITRAGEACTREVLVIAENLLMDSEASQRATSETGSGLITV